MSHINLMTSLSTTGYGIAGFNIALQLSKFTELSIFPFGNYSIESTPEQVKTIQKGINTLPYGDSPCVNIWHQHDLAKRIGNGKYFGWPIFELDKFTQLELAHLSIPNHLIVCSNWAKEVILEYLPHVKIHVVPLGVDTSIFKPDNREENSDYTFINIGKWEKRKGHDFIGRCFDKAFTKNDKVRLILMPHNPFLNERQKLQWENSYRALKLSSVVTISPPVASHRGIAEAINSADCGLFPSRAEGWNLELLETMACNKPVITTNYSAHTEYCNKDNAFLIDIKEKEEAFDGMWFRGQGSWASIDYDEEEQLIEHMRYCYRNNIRTNQAGLHTAESHTWSETASKLWKVINDNS